MRPTIFVVLVLALAVNAQHKAAVIDVTLDNLKIGLLGKDDTPTGSNLESVAPFSKHSKVLDADQNKRIYISVSLKDKATGKPFKAHQVFAIFVHETGYEAIFVFDSQAAGSYSLDINLSKAYKDFDGMSGKYSVRFVSGDALMKNPIDFVFADIKLTIPTVLTPVVPKSAQVTYEPLKEIVHIFRQPDKRPPAFLSLVFTVVCLAPIAVLFFLWLSIGINFGNMPGSIWVPLFHLSLTAVFGLFFVFWLQLDMFETLKYLAIFGAVAFFSGNRVLRSLSNQRKTKTE